MFAGQLLHRALPKASEPEELGLGEAPELKPLHYFY